jgi:hypothetical protein
MVYGQDSAELGNFKRVIKEESKKHERSPVVGYPLTGGRLHFAVISTKYLALYGCL